MFVVCFEEFEVGCGWGLEGGFSKKFSYVRVVTELLLESHMVSKVGLGWEDAFECGVGVSEMFAEGCVYCGR